MKKNNSVVILFFFMHSCFAQSTYYKGEWTVKDKTDLFTCLVKIDIKKDGTATGEFIWKYISIDSSNAELVELYKGKKNKTGIEYTAGTYNAASSYMYLETVKHSDPDMILGSTKYFIKLSAGKQILYGTTTNLNGEEPGLVCLVQIKSSAAKVFNDLKRKIKSR